MEFKLRVPLAAIRNDQELSSIKFRSNWLFNFSRGKNKRNFYTFQIISLHFFNSQLSLKFKYHVRKQSEKTKELYIFIICV